MYKKTHNDTVKCIKLPMSGRSRAVIPNDHRGCSMAAFFKGKQTKKGNLCIKLHTLLVSENPILQFTVNNVVFN